MYTYVGKYLGDLIEHTRKSDLPPNIKSQVVTSLTYFHTQCLCDHDRRDSPAVLRRRWDDLENFIKHTNLLQHFKKDDSRWRAIQTFMGASNTDEELRRTKPVKNNKWAKAEAPDFFEYLARASEEKDLLSELEVIALRFGLYYLEIEAKRTRHQRDRSRIRFTWRYVQPLLLKAKLIQPFYSEKDLIRRVKSFVSDSIL